LLFLVSKGKLLTDPPDLVNAFHLLLCCINFTFVHAPHHFRKVSLKDTVIAASNSLASQTPPPQVISSPDGVNTLPYLCTINNANYAEVAVVQDHLFIPFINLVSI
jgi:hypothetical protein